MTRKKLNAKTSQGVNLTINSHWFFRVWSRCFLYLLPTFLTALTGTPLFLKQK